VTDIVTLAVASAMLLGGPAIAAAAAAPPATTPPDAARDADEDGADDAAEEEPAPTPEEAAHERALDELTAALRGLRAAEDGLRAARGGSAGADGALRRGEEGLVPVVLTRLQTEGEVEAATRRLDAAERRLRRTAARLVALAERAVEVGAELDVARVQLEERVIRAYKTGSLAYEASLPLTMIREASSPGELATAVKNLATLMEVGLDHVEALVDELLAIELETAATEAERERAERAVATATDELAAAEDAQERATAELGRAESRAVALRASAYAAEARLVSAVLRLGSAQAELAVARDLATTTAAKADAPPPEVAGATRDEDGEDEQATQWAARERALARARSLAAEDRRTADDWVCPVEGAQFINDWGFPRSSERRHEGTDVFAPLGTPVVAPTDAVVQKLDAADRFDGRRDLGGITVWLEHDRHRYYLAHLDAIEPALQVGDEVEAGAVVGWVGRSGNARGTPPHLHLGWYVDGIAVNPYASLAVACSSERPPQRSDTDTVAPRG
jgi:peptidoglycan LD-endopeptidase LytH